MTKYEYIKATIIPPMETIHGTIPGAIGYQLIQRQADGGYRIVKWWIKRDA